MSDKQYPIAGYAPGSYQCKCADCGVTFSGDKRATQCEPCATEAMQEYESLTPKQRAIFDNDRAQIFKLFMELQEIKSRAESPKGCVWVKGAPSNPKHHFAKVPSMLDEGVVYDAIIWPLDGTDQWWAVGEGFKYTLHKSKIIAHMDETTPTAYPKEDAAGSGKEEAESKALLQWLIDNEWGPVVGEEYINHATGRTRTVSQLYDIFKQNK